MLKNFNVITRHSILTVAAQTPAEALQRAHISNNENAFIRECGDSNDSSFIVELVSYSLKRFGVLIEFSGPAKNILESETGIREKLKQDTYNTHFGTEHILYALATLFAGPTREFFEKKGINREKLLPVLSVICYGNADERPQNLLLDSFIYTISCCGVYLDTRTLFLSIFREGSNVEQIIRLMGFDMNAFVREYISLFSISEYFLDNPGTTNHNRESCFDGLDIYRYVQGESQKTEQIKKHLKECGGLCLRSADFIQSSYELIEEKKRKPRSALW